MTSPTHSPRYDHDSAQSPPRKRAMLSLPHDDGDALLRESENTSAVFGGEHAAGPSQPEMTAASVYQDPNEASTSSGRKRTTKTRRAPKRRRSKIDEEGMAEEAQDSFKTPIDNPEVSKKEETPRPTDPEIESDGVRSSEPLADYSCPICFSPPTNATLTPCGHICCGECLFTAVRAILQRANTRMSPEPPIARCPVCRAALTGWDGQGGGVIGLNVKTIISL